MKHKLILCLVCCLLLTRTVHAQWIVTDPVNLAGNIANTIKEIATASKTVNNTLSNFKEVEKLYNDTKRYYDALKKVNNLIGDAYKVKETILMVGDMTEMYVGAYKKMLSDPNYSPEELSAMAAGYAKLMERSSESLKELKSLVRSGALSMNDKERIELIDRIYNEVKEYRAATSYFTRKNISVSFVRAAKKGEMARVNALYGSSRSTSSRSFAPSSSGSASCSPRRSSWERSTPYSRPSCKAPKSSFTCSKTTSNRSATSATNSRKRPTGATSRGLT